MAFDTFDTLKDAVREWVHRDDLTDRIPDFIALGEARIGRELRLRRQVTTITSNTTAGTRTIALPNDFLELARLRCTSPDQPIDYIAATQIASAYFDSDTGSPRRFAIEGAELHLYPKPDAIYSIALTYYARVPALSASAPTNWLLSEQPGLYLFAALAEAAPFIGQDERAPMWDGRFRAEAESVRTADMRAQSSGSGLRIRAR